MHSSEVVTPVKTGVQRFVTIYHFLIPAKAGIQYCQTFSGFRVKPGMANGGIMQMPQLINNDQDDRFVKYQFFISSSFLFCFFSAIFTPAGSWALQCHFIT
jgi:hypothetical protein